MEGKAGGRAARQSAFLFFFDMQKPTDGKEPHHGVLTPALKGGARAANSVKQALLHFSASARPLS